MTGRYAAVERLDPGKHGDSLWSEVGGLEKADYWRWMPDGPFATRTEFDAVLAAKSTSSDPLFYALVDRATGLAAGHASYMRIEPKHRVIEVGGIMFGPSLQRTRAATESMYLMARHAFEDLNYRRYEWKCNALNEPSRRAALRYGFSFEGIFRRHMLIKGANRDTAWFSLLDAEWPERKAEFERWLDPANFDAQGRQLTPLACAGLRKL